MHQFKPVKVYSMIFLMVVFVESCFACSCARTPVSERFDNVNYVFTAEIIAAKLLIEPDAKYRSTADKIKIELGPRQDFKNDSSHLEYLYTNSGGSSCGLAVTIGATHTFLVNESGMISLCGSIVEHDERKEFYQLLRVKNPDK